MHSDIVILRSHMYFNVHIYIYVQSLIQIFFYYNHEPSGLMKTIFHHLLKLISSSLGGARTAHLHPVLL